MSYRTHAAGSLRPAHIGHTVQLSGWAQAIRRFKSQAFVELREGSGKAPAWSSWSCPSPCWVS